ncbi:MAG: nitronate monooxygenase [Chloroflexi bacterium]|nr:MAG: nitronate monooxygenase [Chloroflexota bacterium]TME41609.1 MAG: nitronate monooxygenase [Chloroflexota bacterium]TME51795.1 MAG: nitronate monooxygenase [Chloroflexota bacterium]
MPARSNRRPNGSRPIGTRVRAISWCGWLGPTSATTTTRCASSWARLAMHDLRTPICSELGIQYPIFSAGIGSAAGPELAAAVSNAGGFGVLGMSGMKPAELSSRIGSTRKLTDRPIGINIIIAETEEGDRKFFTDQIEAAGKAGAAAVVMFWGDPAPYIDTAHRNGIKVFIQVGSVEEALSAARAGVDAVIAQGLEAGGHVRGTTSIWELLPATVDAVKPLPVLASGGIGDGAGLARALRMGAQGVSLGTRFVASDEAWLHPAYKQRIVESTADDTVYNTLYDVWWPDAPHRTLRNKTFAEWEAAGRPPSGSRPGEGTSIGRRRMPNGEWTDWPRYAVGSVPPEFDGDIEYAPLWAGESCSVVNDIKPAAEIIRDLVGEAGRVDSPG